MLSKLRKILQMAERGTKHEASVARSKLNNLLEKHGLTIDDIREQEKKIYDFNFHNKHDKSLLFPIVAYATNSTSIPWYKGSNTRKMGFELTRLQYETINELWETYKEPLRAEIEKYLSSVFSAYISKHNLFPDRSDEEENKGRELSLKELELLKSLMRNMDDINRPCKKIEE